MHIFPTEEEDFPCLHRKIFMEVKQNPILSLYIKLIHSVAKNCYRDPHISLIFGNMCMDQAAV